MSEFFIIPKRPIFAIALASLMCLHAVVFYDMINDDTVPASNGEMVLVFLGWFWWAFLLWSLFE